ncbi:DUF2726 domain-containing protein [Escherichia coli]|uniref:DUF2726 domain-containing protein n=2 Tax=Escherichia coli TaxID=562 RepID=UPI000B0D3365|nr:DUF2726 domain-containing protein [Escherichia coli]EFH3722623.1 DUF2726 domain-containing protein [Escherichia coli]
MRKYIPLVLFIFSWPALSADIHGRVVRVLDGDTIEVMDSRKAVRIRLVNIDAPEKKQDYGRWSTDMMKSLVAGKTVIRPRSRQWWQLFRMVSQWHVDVVIVERRLFSIVAAVELDDASHLRPERRRRDILLEEVLRQAGIPLLRSHDARKLLQMTGEWLNTTGADQQSPVHRS